MGVATNNIHIINDPLAVTSSSNEAISIVRNVPSLKIGETDDGESLVANPQAPSMALQPLPTSLATYLQPGTENIIAQQDPLHQLRLQMNGLLGRLQQTEQQTQQIQQQMEEVLGRTQQTDHRMEEVLGKIQEYDQRMQEALRAIQEADGQQEETIGTTRQTGPQAQSIQRLQQQLSEALERIQQIDQQAKDSQGRYEQLLQQRYQETLQAFHYLTLVQYRVQAILTASSQNLPVPRLFIALPEPTAVVDGQNEPHLQLRVTKNGNELHEIHLVDHPGYELVNQDDFIKKYGAYLLTMIYMVKYGIKAGGLIVLPLLGLKDATNIRESQGHLQSIMKNIKCLVDATIAHLESAIGIIDSGTIIIHQDLDSLELSQLQSHLKLKDGEGSIEDLWPVATPDGHYAWICRYHLLEYYNSALLRLKVAIGASGGVCRDTKVQLKITSETTTKRLYDAITDVCRVQNMRKWEELRNGISGLGGLSSAARSPSEIVSTLDGMESLSLSNGRLSMVANGISRGVIGDVTLEVERLSDLEPDDLEFIRHCQPIILKILRASKETDEARLVDILQHSTKLRNLHVGCDFYQSFVLINSILSTREKTLQIRGRIVLRGFAHI
ncbi:hypothetical protein BGX34_004510 [Mortierella sp. NVP85]|nr:hypothetical protein BGX34_004510 [Mortierella sp. NVP85]